MAEGLHGSSSSGRKLTWEDWVATPDDRNRYEILDGKLAVTPPPFIRHQRVSGRLQALLWRYVEEGGLGEVFDAPVGVVLDEHTMVEPDLVFVSSSRAAIIQERAMVGAPDLLVEILSPSTARRDRTVKLMLYARFGVPHYWIVDPEKRELFAFELAQGGAYGPARIFSGDERAEMVVPPGFVIDLSRIWA